MDSLLTLLGDTQTMEYIIAAVVGILTAYKVPAWIGSLIIQLAPVAVKLVEQTMKKRPNSEKKAAAIAAVKEKLPGVIRTIPGIDKRIGDVVDNVVKALPPTFSPVAPSRKEMKDVLGG
jgi:hypothetical protein